VPAKKKAVYMPKLSAMLEIGERHIPVICPACRKACADVSAHAGDNGILKARCTDEICADYGVPREVPSA
jgi:hypothetical protein